MAPVNRQNGFNKVSKISMAAEGMGMVALGLLSNTLAPYLDMTNNYGTGFIALGAGVAGLGLYLGKSSKYDKLFSNCGLKNADGMLPIILKEEKSKENAAETTLVVHMPEGLCQTDFEKKRQELEQGLNCKIQFSFNTNLIMKLWRMQLGSKYDYLYEKQDSPLAVYLGETYSGKFILDIEKCPHVIVAGETDSGKSTCLDIISTSLIMNPYPIELHMIDFQAVTLGKFEFCKKVKSYGESPEDFDALMDKMAEENKRRLALFRSVKNKHFVEKLNKWNKLYPEQALPHIVVIVDEITRLSDDQYDPIMEKFRLRVSMDRKVGIHYIIAMQRPDVKCIAGSVKANMPCRLAFRCVTDTDSEVILDVKGAEKLVEKGRFLAKYCGQLTESQNLFCDPDEIGNLLKKGHFFKTREEIQAELKKQDDVEFAKQQEYMKEWRARNPNKYAQGS